MRHLGAVWLLVLCAGARVRRRSRRHAAGRGRQERQPRRAVRALLEARVDVNAAEVDGTTRAPLGGARRRCGDGAPAAARGRRRVKAANRYGVTPLSVAATNGHVPMIETLLKAGADRQHGLARGRNGPHDGGAHRDAGASRRSWLTAPTSTRPRDGWARPR